MIQKLISLATLLFYHSFFSIKFIITSTLCLGLLMMICLILRQLFIGLQRDKRYNLPLPSRLLIGKGALPIIGHTHYIRWYGCDETYKMLFHYRNCAMRTSDQELSSKFCYSKVEETFAVFVYAQWRVFIHGPDRIQKVISEGQLKPSWGYFMPKSLLGITYPGLLSRRERKILQQLLGKPLGHDHVIKMAPKIGLLAKRFIDELIEGGDSIDPESVPQDKSIGFQRKNDNLYSIKGGRAITAQRLKEFSLDVMTSPILNLQKDNSNYVPSEYDRTHSMDHVSKNVILFWLKRIQKGMLG